MAQTVKEPIAKQPSHDTKQTFAAEFIEFLNQQGFEYDPQYVFEMEIVTRIIPFVALRR